MRSQILKKRSFPADSGVNLTSCLIYIWDLKASFTLITTKAFTKTVFKTQPQVKDWFEVSGKLILVNKISTPFSECEILGQIFGVP